MKPIAIFLAEKLENLVATEDWLLINNSADELRRLQAKVERLEAPQPKEPEQECVAYQDTAEKCRLETVSAKGTLFNTTQPQRTAAEGEDTRRAWVGLTDEEIDDILWKDGCNHLPDIIRIVEAKLKEKNT